MQHPSFCTHCVPPQFANCFAGLKARNFFSRKGAKKVFKNAAALCAFAALREEYLGVKCY